MTCSRSPCTFSSRVIGRSSHSGPLQGVVTLGTIGQMALVVSCHHCQHYSGSGHTSDVLKLLSPAAFDPQPVLGVLVENAVRLADATWGYIYRFDGEVFRIVAEYGVPPEVKDFWRRTPLRVGRGSGAGRAALERRTIHIPDVLADSEDRS